MNSIIEAQELHEYCTPFWGIREVLSLSLPYFGPLKEFHYEQNRVNSKKALKSVEVDQSDHFVSSNQP